MAEHFLTKSGLDLSLCLEVSGRIVLEMYPALHQTLQSHVGPEVAALFAEPLISRGNDSAPASVSWYSEFSGDGVPLSRLDEAAQAEVGAVLSRELRALRDLIDHPDDGPLVAAALHLASANDIWVVNGKPVLINWGMLPPNGTRDSATRTAHYDKTLGRYLPLAAAPPLTARERENRRGSLALTPGGAATGVAGAAAASTEAGPVLEPLMGAGGAGPVDVAPVSRRLPVVAWLPLLLLLLLAGGVLAWLLTPGTRIFPADPGTAAQLDVDALALAEGVNRDLEGRLATLQDALAGAQCRADGTLLMPGGRTIEGLLPPDPADPSDIAGHQVTGIPNPILPPDPARTFVRPAGDATGQADATMGLLERIEQSTVMVLANVADGLSTGTGFFVGPDLVVTNFHVVSEVEEGGLFVTSRALGRAYPATLIKALGPLEQTGADFGLLRVDGVHQPSFDILRAPSSLKLQAVVAAGYPGDVLNSDADFAALMQGQENAVPDITVTDGIVNAEQLFQGATRVVVHSAEVSRGNSGGPLVDTCGRLVGVNTFVVQGDMRNLNFALDTGQLLTFLEGQQIGSAVVTTPCVPQVQRPMAPPPETAQTETEHPALPPLTPPTKN